MGEGSTPPHLGPAGGGSPRRARRGGRRGGARGMPAPSRSPSRPRSQDGGRGGAVAPVTPRASALRRSPSVDRAVEEVASNLSEWEAESNDGEARAAAPRVSFRRDVQGGRGDRGAAARRRSPTPAPASLQERQGGRRVTLTPHASVRDEEAPGDRGDGPARGQAKGKGKNKKGKAAGKGVKGGKPGGGAPGKGKYWGQARIGKGGKLAFGRRRSAE